MKAKPVTTKAATMMILPGTFFPITPANGIISTATTPPRASAWPAESAS